MKKAPSAAREAARLRDQRVKRAEALVLAAARAPAVCPPGTTFHPMMLWNVWDAAERLAKAERG